MSRRLPIHRLLYPRLRRSLQVQEQPVQKHGEQYRPGSPKTLNPRVLMSHDFGFAISNRWMSSGLKSRTMRQNDPGVTPAYTQGLPLQAISATDGFMPWGGTCLANTWQFSLTSRNPFRSLNLRQPKLRGISTQGKAFAIRPSPAGLR